MDGRHHTSGGKIRLSLAEGGEEVPYTSSSGKLRTERTCERRGGLYMFGDGESRLTIETSSGNLEIQ